MKKIILYVIAIVVLISCNPSQNVSMNSKLKGSWSITETEYRGAAGIIIKDAMGIADLKCFDGSVWNFIPNNNSGTFTLQGGGNCPAENNAIKWYIDPEQNFIMKYVNGVKGKNVKSGYEFQLREVTNTSFILVDNEVYDGKNVQIVYHFIKN